MAHSPSKSSTLTSGLTVEMAASSDAPSAMREAVELRYGAGLQVNEVARALGISRFAARRRIDAALKLLAEELEGGDLDG